MSIVAHGTEVFGSDGRCLGTVSAVRRGCFEVQLSDRVAISLRAEAILTVADHRVTLLCDATRLRRYACPDHS